MSGYKISLLLGVKKCKISATDFTNDCTLSVSLKNTKTDALITLKQVELIKRRNIYQKTQKWHGLAIK